jgi:hypothetical protein
MFIGLWDFYHGTNMGRSRHLGEETMGFVSYCTPKKCMKKTFKAKTQRN